MKYIDKFGFAVKADDPARLIWYSANCTYYTDDWDKLKTVGVIPCCPVCQCVGFMVSVRKWDANGAKFTETHPGYDEVIKQHKEICSQKTLLELWEESKA